MTSRLSWRVALLSLVALMLLSAAFVLVRVNGLSPGYLIALAKLIALAYLLRRIGLRDVYAMQWSSMFILLFMAEGTVRATSDPQPLAAMGALEAVLATVYFVAVLGYLRPLKKLARQARK